MWTSFWTNSSSGRKWSYLPTRIAPVDTLFGHKNIQFNAGTRSSHPASVQSSPYLNHSDIKRRAIQVLYSEGASGSVPEGAKNQWFYIKVIHPNKPFRRIFDIMTVLWVLYLVFFIPLEIGFSWFIESPKQKKFLTFLDVWFALDFILNFRTGYICHGTVIMDQKRIFWYELCILFFFFNYFCAWIV